ncbi:ABC transporter ATP-binding protein [Aurantivibrio plasticivorans]
MGSAISIDYLSHTFKGASEPTLKELCTNIAREESVCLIGRSGCGKSTLLHMLAGLLMPSDGCVRIDGHQVTKPCAKWNMMFQSASLYPWMDVAANVGLGLQFAGVAKKDIRRRVAELLELVGLADYAGERVTALSGGQQQRVALARSLATEPSVLLLDEPFSALDTFTRRALQIDVPAICREKKVTLVTVTHDIDEAILMADRVMIMARNPGRIIGELDIDLPRSNRHSHPRFQTLHDELMKQFSASNNPAQPDAPEQQPDTSEKSKPKHLSCVS